MSESCDWFHRYLTYYPLGCRLLNHIIQTKYQLKQCAYYTYYIGLYYTVIVLHANLLPTDKTIAVGVESGLNNNALIYYSTPR